MGFTHPLRSRALSSVLAATLLSASLVATAAASASAATAQQISLSTQALPTAQVNGVVWSQVVVGNTVYVGGDFSQAWNLAGTKVARANVLAFDLASGDLLSNFSAATNGPVEGIAASPDGSRIYITGNFTTVNGAGRAYAAALDPSSGALITSFAPSLNSGGTGVTATNSTAYVVGKFTAVNGKSVSKAAGLSASSGALTSWHPAFGTGIVRSITKSPDGSIVLVGGGFTTVNGQHAGGFAPTNASSGALIPWAANAVIDAGGPHTGIYGMSSDSNYAYITGWSYQTLQSEFSFEGVASISWATGQINWVEDCHGDSYSVTSTNGIAYVASHSHYCKNVPNGFDELPANTGHRATAFSVQAVGTLAHNTKQGPNFYTDFGGQPAPTIEGFLPELQAGYYTGQGQAAWSVTSSGNYVVYGGEFLSVNGVAQKGLVRFYEPATSPVSAPVATPTPTPTATDPTPTPTTDPTSGTSDPTAARHIPATPAKPSVTVRGTSSVKATWKAVSGRGSTVTGYKVSLLNTKHQVVKTKTVKASSRSVTFTGLTAHKGYVVKVAAKNAQGSSKWSLLSKTATTKDSHKKPRTVHAPSLRAVSKARLAVTWSEPSSSGVRATTEYRVKVYSGSKLVKQVVVSSEKRSVTIAGLRGSRTYTVTVSAKNSVGWGHASTKSKGKTHKR